MNHQYIGLPQEKVYLHFDNSSYYHGDKIWFKAYVVFAPSNGPTPLSQTLYVELLNPGGRVMEGSTEASATEISLSISCLSIPDSTKSGHIRNT